MNLFYLDNFRGFSNTIIKLVDVNFLVGENSTGKSSILSIISILSDIQFWLTNELNTNYTELGGFEDIRSQNSDMDYFAVGIYNRIKNKKSETKYYANIINFYDNNGLSSPKDIFILENNNLANVKINYDINKINYKIIENIKIKYDGDDKNHFKNIIKYISELNLTDFNEIEIESMGKVPFFAYFNLGFEKDKQKKELFRDIIPINFIDSREMSFIAPIRAKPKSIYIGNKMPVSSEGDHTPFLLKSLLKEDKKSDVIKYIFEFGKESGMFDKIEVVDYLKKDTSPFEIDICKYNNSLKISSVGYGVSQILPILIELVSIRKNSWISIQQPEIHLHPKAQAAFGELIFNICKNEKKYLNIETHSDYIIDRFRYLISKNQDKVDIPSQILFFENNGRNNLIHEIPIAKDGKYPNDQPEKFREFFLNEYSKILGL